MPSSPAPLLIGVSARIYHPQSPVADIGGIYTRTLHYLEQSVAHWVMSGGAMPVMIPEVERDGLVRRSDVRLDWYAHQLDPRLPNPPRGTIAGGPNGTAPSSGDPVAAAKLPGCVQQLASPQVGAVNICQQIGAGGVEVVALGEKMR